LDPYAGNLANTSLTFDYTDEATFVYAAGQGPIPAGRSRFPRTPQACGFAPGAGRTVPGRPAGCRATQVQDAADAALRDNRGLVTYESKIIETPSNRYGIEYKFGDILPCQFLNQLVDCMLTKVHVSVSNALETIDVGLHGLVTSAANGSGGTGTDSNLVVLTNGSGSTIAQYALVGYLSAGNITLANSTTGSDIPAIGIALSAITAGATGQVRTGGILAGLSSLTSGALYFSNPSTPGTFTNSPGSVGSTKSQYIGRALSTTTLLIEIAEPILVAAATGTIVIKRNPSTGRIEETNVASLQSAYPGTADTGNVHVNGTVGADTRINLSTVPMLERGGTFPTSGLVDGQSYFHTTYRAWFIYNLTDTKWRQEAPGVFASSFPTVASGDNTVAPQITVKRLDRNNTNWYWDGTRWLSEQVFKMPLISRSSQPFPQAVTVFDLHLVDFATYGGIYLSKIGSGVFFSAAQNATNFYTMSASIFDTSGASTAITLTGTTDTKTYTTAGSFRPMVPTITPTAYGNTNMLLVVIMTPTLNPGTFFQNISAQFQLIG
jgi:hypothetical protein